MIRESMRRKEVMVKVESMMKVNIKAAEKIYTMRKSMIVVVVTVGAKIRIVLLGVRVEIEAARECHRLQITVIEVERRIGIEIEAVIDFRRPPKSMTGKEIEAERRRDIEIEAKIVMRSDIEKRRDRKSVV